MAQNYITYSKAKRKGKADGRNWRWQFWPFSKVPKQPQPALDQKVPPGFEKEMKQATDDMIKTLISKWQKVDEKLHQKYCNALAYLAGAIQRKNKECKESTIAEQLYDKSREKYNQYSRPALNSTIEKILLIIIAIFEFPLNSFVFALFGQGKFETYLIAAGICIAIPLAAHFWAIFLKRENKTTGEKIWAFLIPMIILGLIGFVSYLRNKYFAVMMKEQGVENYLAPSMTTTVFIFINLATFIVATVISFEAAHADRLYYSAKTEYEKAKKSFSKESKEAKAAIKDYIKAIDRVQGYKIKREKSYEYYKSLIDEVIERFQTYVAIYESANMAVREEAKVPYWFNLDIDTKFNFTNTALTPLNWNCRNVELSEEVSKEIGEKLDA